MSKSALNNKKQKEAKKIVSNKTINLIPIAFYDDENECFVKQNSEVFDLLQFKTKNLLTSDDNTIEEDIFKITGYLRTTLYDVKIIAINFAVDTHQQQQYFKHKIELCKNNVFREMLERKLIEVSDIAKNKTQREYYLMIFSANNDSINDDRLKALQSLGGLITTVKKEKKIQVLKRINNKAKG